jgi:hypothetical protein
MLLKVRSATRFYSKDLVTEKSVEDYLDESQASFIPTAGATAHDLIFVLTARGMVERGPHNETLITPKGRQVLSKATTPEFRIALNRRLREVRGPKRSQVRHLAGANPVVRSEPRPRWECDNCGALNKERSGPCEGCRLTSPTRHEVSS